MTKYVFHRFALGKNLPALGNFNQPAVPVGGVLQGKVTLQGVGDGGGEDMPLCDDTF